MFWHALLVSVALAAQTPPLTYLEAGRMYDPIEYPVIDNSALYASVSHQEASTSTESFIEEKAPINDSRGIVLEENGIVQLLKKHFGDKWQIFKEIAYAESRLNPNAVNDNPATGDYSIGLFQVNLFGKLADHRPSKEWLLVPENNVKYAKQLYAERGFSHWSVCKDKVVCE